MTIDFDYMLLYNRYKRLMVREPEIFMHVNKFNFAWQLVRVNARKIAMPEKVAYVMDFLHRNPSPENRDRVLNWLRMTQLGFKNKRNDWELLFFGVMEHVSNMECTAFDNDNTQAISNASTTDIKTVLDDLNKRKYGFQFAGKIPQEHKEFVQLLTDTLNLRQLKAQV